MARPIPARVAPLFIRRTDLGIMLVDDQGRIIAGQLSTIVSNPGDRPTFGVEFAIGLDVAWEGDDFPDAPALQALFTAWAAMSPANRKRFANALDLAHYTVTNLKEPAA